MLRVTPRRDGAVRVAGHLAADAPGGWHQVIGDCRTVIPLSGRYLAEGPRPVSYEEAEEPVSSLADELGLSAQDHRGASKPFFTTCGTASLTYGC